MVAYLKKPEGSEGFHQIVDFLNASHIRYALTENPTIYVSLIKQFWQTATARTLNNGEIELTATIDGKVKTVTEGSPRSPTQTLVADKTVHEERGDSVERVATTATSLDADLIKKVKKLEKTVKSSQARRRARNVVSDDEDDLEDSSKQGRKIAEIDQDPGISLEVSTIKKDVSTAEPVSTTGAVVTTASVAVSSPIRNTGVSTVDDINMAETLVYIRNSAAKDKAVRLQAEFDEEGRLQAEERENNTEAEQARMLAELINQRKRYFATQRAKERRNKPPTQAQQRTYMSNYIKNMGESEVDRAVPELADGSSKRVAEEELDQESTKRKKTGESSELAEEPRDKEADELFTLKALGSIGRSLELEIILSLVIEKFNSTEPTYDKEREIWVELKRLFELDTDDELWKLQKKIHDLTWRLYDSCGVHHVYTEEGIDIYMLVEKEYPLSRGTLTLMLVAKLLVDQDNEMSRELLRKIFMQVERPRR
ncbi:hypothetical protein Tco_1145195 [Tanacetum coccineum]